MMNTESAKKSKNIVYAITRASRCYGCDTRLNVGDIIKMRNKDDDREVLCRTCAGLSDFELLPKGDAKLSRLASKYSSTTFTVMQWSELWKCYERVGILVTPDALLKAKNE
jgi:hypothetical protein